MIVNNKLQKSQTQLQIENQSQDSIVFKIYNSKMSYHEFVISDGRIAAQEIITLPLIVNSSISMIQSESIITEGQTMVWCFDNTENSVLQVLRLKQRELKKIIFEADESQTQQKLLHIPPLVPKQQIFQQQPSEKTLQISKIKNFQELDEQDIFMQSSGIFDQQKNDIENATTPTQLFNENALFTLPTLTAGNIICGHDDDESLQEENISRPQNISPPTSEPTFHKNNKQKDEDQLQVQQKIQDIELVTANLVLQAEYIEDIDVILNKMADKINMLTQQSKNHKKMIVQGRFEQYLTCGVLIFVVVFLKFLYEQ